MKRLMAFLVGIVGLGLAVSSATALAATECNGAPLSGTIAGGVVVNANDFCILDAATVYGGVQVNPGGILLACGSTIYGGVVSNGAVNVLLGAGEDEPADCLGNVISGGVFINNTAEEGVVPGAPTIAVERDIVEGGVHLAGNKGRVVVASSVINGGLSCNKNNSDLDNEGTPNVIAGRITCEFGE
jgi:hypothetical protein